MVIELQNADIYQSHFLLLNDVNMYIAEGEFCYVVGKTGTGKSSLLKTIYGALPLQNGEGRVVGMNLKQVDRRNLHLLRRKMGMIFQDFNLFPHYTVIENLVLAPTLVKKMSKDEANKQAINLLKLF